VLPFLEGSRAPSICRYPRNYKRRSRHPATADCCCCRCPITMDRDGRILAQIWVWPHCCPKGISCVQVSAAIKCMVGSFRITFFFHDSSIALTSRLGIFRHLRPEKRSSASCSFSPWPLTAYLFTRGSHNFLFGWACLSQEGRWFSFVHFSQSVSSLSFFVSFTSVSRCRSLSFESVFFSSSSFKAGNRYPQWRPDLLDFRE
jgi:hypothetical protein